MQWKQWYQRRVRGTKERGYIMCDTLLASCFAVHSLDCTCSTITQRSTKEGKRKRGMEKVCMRKVRTFNESFNTYITLFIAFNCLSLVSKYIHNVIKPSIEEKLIWWTFSSEDKKRYDLSCHNVSYPL
eukprot:TRINITY_DN5171_c0_g1_i3.p1 TRINITY_DN5171_c0_g1~~TRINITY_DN5171_c0_g1_i3.p1  ORF type:complete len:128 (-),score=28.95 TRINITY_DN5171_c0_g1_i3:165-548(-)